VKQVVLTLALIVVGLHLVGAQQGSEDAQRADAEVRLAATRHAALPTDRTQYWYVRDIALARSAASDPALAKLARGVKAIAEGNFATGLPLVNDPALASTPLADYARYYSGVALARLSRLSEADAVRLSSRGRPASPRRNRPGPSGQSSCRAHPS
jgi:hypothetical protein